MEGHATGLPFLAAFPSDKGQVRGPTRPCTNHLATQASNVGGPRSPVGIDLPRWTKPELQPTRPDSRRNTGQHTIPSHRGCDDSLPIGLRSAGKIIKLRLFYFRLTRKISVLRNLASTNKIWKGHARSSTSTGIIFSIYILRPSPVRFRQFSIYGIPYMVLKRQIGAGHIRGKHSQWRASNLPRCWPT